MPSLGADMTEGTLVQWNVKPGDHVKRGDIVAIVATDKADIEVEVYESGIIDSLSAEPGEKLAVGSPMAIISAEGSAKVRSKVAKAEPAEKPKVKKVPAPKPKEPEKRESASRLRASPLARRLAEELAVDLNAISGTGPGGAIQRADVEEAAQAKPPTEPGPSEAGAGMRRAIAAAMSRANREIPHYYLSTRIDMSAALRWLEEFNRQRSLEHRILPAALLLKAVARALVEVPELNGFWDGDQLQPAADIHIGLAVSLRSGGLMLPTIHSVDRRPLEEVMDEMREVITRTRSGRLRSSDLSGGTITVTNLGDLGVETVFGVIYPPQVALVGFGKIVERPWADHGMLGVRPLLTATLAADHRATDGRRGAQFLDFLGSFLQKPGTL